MYYKTRLLIVPPCNNFEQNLTDEEDFMNQKSKIIQNFTNYSTI